ncbi:hypothetical protein L1085_005930 [Streptomyces sp. MSC1_001]|jgi:hypothetical protein
MSPKETSRTPGGGGPRRTEALTPGRIGTRTTTLIGVVADGPSRAARRWK